MMNQECLEYGIARHGTPMYVFDLDQLRKTVKRFRNILGNQVELCFAMKANPFLVNKIEPFVSRIEVCSMGEYKICKSRRIPPEKILISGVLKEKEDLFEILEDCGGRCSYTVESLNQMQVLSKWCDANKETIRVYLRLSSGNQFGVDMESIKNMIVVRKMYPFIKIKGIHYFSGTQKRRLQDIKEELCFLDDRYREIKEEIKFSMEELEYGPGLSVSYFSGQEDHTENDIRAVKGFLNEMDWKGNVMLEMGRVLTASCGYYLTRVCDIKQNEGRNYCIVDGGIHQMNYDGQIRGIYQPLLKMIPKQEDHKPKEWTVCGSLCTANDVLVQKITVSNLQIGSVFAFQNTGAYSMTEGMALFLSHELPKIAFYEKKTGWKLIREEISTYQFNMEEKTNESINENFKRIG